MHHGLLQVLRRPFWILAAFLAQVGLALGCRLKGPENSEKGGPRWYQLGHTGWGLALVTCLATQSRRLITYNPT